MRRTNFLEADQLANKFRIKPVIQSVRNSEVVKGITTQQVVYASLVIAGTVTVIYALHYYSEQKAEKKKNAKLLNENERLKKSLDEQYSYFSTRIQSLQRRTYR